MTTFGYMDVAPSRWFCHGDVSDCGLVYSARADLFLDVSDAHWVEEEADVNERRFYSTLDYWNRCEHPGFYRPANAPNLIRFELANEDLTDLLETKP